MRFISLVSTFIATVNAAAAVTLPSTVNNTSTTSLFSRDDEHGTKVCVDANFGGYCQTFSNRVSGLADNACIRLDDTIRGKVSSVKPFGPSEGSKGTYCRYFVSDHCEDYDSKACGRCETGMFAGFSDLKKTKGISWHEGCDFGDNMDKKIKSFLCWFPYTPSNLE